MDDNQNLNQNQNQSEPVNVPEAPQKSTNALWVAVVVILCIAAVAVGFIVQQRKVANQLSARNEDLTASLTQTQGQLQTLTSELNTLQAQQAAREKAEREAALRRQHMHQYAAARKVVNKDDPRWKQVQAELAAHQKAIESAQQDLQSTRSELQGNLDSTRNELSGSIAKTHAELVELEKKGERNYYEFDIYKSKQFQRVGPVEVSLRKTNAKHEFCDLQVIVNDREMAKKHINIYEPVAFYTEQEGQPVQLVINSITRNHMHGYVSAPKYQGSQRAASNASANGAVAAASTNNGSGAAAQPSVADLQHRPSN